MTIFIVVVFISVVISIRFDRVTFAHAHSRHVVLQRVRQVVRIREVKVGRQIDGLEHFYVFRLLGVVLTHAFVGNVDHGNVFHFVDSVMSYQSNFAPLCDEDHVITCLVDKRGLRPMKRAPKQGVANSQLETTKTLTFKKFHKTNNAKC